MSESFIIISPPPRLRWLGSVPTPRFNEPSPTEQWGSREGQIARQDNKRPLAESRSRRQRKPAKVDRDKLACPPNPVRATRDPPIYAARPTPPNYTSSQLVTRSNLPGDSNPCCESFWSALSAPETSKISSLVRALRPC